MTALTRGCIDALKNFNWQEIIHKSGCLEDLNERQWRFIKGLIVELIVEKNSGAHPLIYVGGVGKDYYWPKFDITVELKSGLSGGMYTGRGELRKTFTVKFSNTNGTNKQQHLDPDKIADILLVIKNDGAFAVDKDTVLRCSRSCGDGFDLVLTKEDITELTGKVDIGPRTPLDLRNRLTEAIRNVI